MNDYGNSAAMGAMAGMITTIYIFALVFGVFMIVCLWKIYTKAGKQGWEAIIPIYSTMILAEICGKPSWWGIVINFVPCIGLPVMYFILMIELAKSFGKSTAFGIGLIFFSIIFLPMLAFGDATYVGPGGVAKEPIAPTV